MRNYLSSLLPALQLGSPEHPPVAREKKVEKPAMLHPEFWLGLHPYEPVRPEQLRLF